VFEDGILVVGGGIAGLTSAIALRERGFRVEVIERDPSWSVYGVGIIQQANVVRAMAQLGVLDDYLGSAFGFDHVQMFAPDGAPIARIPSPRLADAAYPANVGIGRPALHKVLGEKAKAVGAAIRLGVTAETIADDPAASAVEVAFSDGSKGRYALVIGADGLYSTTRRALFPDAPTPEFSGQAVWRYNFPRSADVDGLQVYHGRVGAGLVPLSASTMYMYLTSAEPTNPRFPREGLAGQMRARTAGAAPRIRALAEQITDDAAVVYKPLETLFLDGPWHAGRMVLIGDAVHASTPHLGQGAGMAIEDSLVLAEELARHGAELETAFQAFEARRRDRCRFIVESSRAVGEFQLGKRDQLDYAALTREMFEVTSAPI
jgi:2-polyprenyl-6-methoxyphenol hydroxylase-like FAD-dependent oxidoreductase